eukprot:TRINITY_DN265_c0_g1_i5.p1 TRINITY_DN265_c0_g1~~TRINITY_DN265_c0_g1_i5.p1  ORF type:complete len:403 (+),score=8.78 TRINITY_DN265_c0_g1_i5:44-1210(+)
MEESNESWETKKIANWNCGDVVRWAKHIGLSEEDASLLTKNKVNGKALILASKSLTFLTTICEIPGGPALILFNEIGKLLDDNTTLLDMSHSESNEWLNCEYLRKAKIQLPIPEGRMFIREDYKKIQAIIESSIEKHVRYLIIGTPGIGKSCFLIYLLNQFLKANRTVVLQRSAEKDQIYLFSGGRVTKSPRISTFQSELDKEDTWYLVDTIDNPGLMQAKTVFVSSPLNRHYNLFRKEVYVKTLYMPEWSETEMETLYKEIGGMDREEFNNKLTKLGGVPRLVFGTVVDSADRLIARAISKINFRTWDGAINDLETTEGSNSNVILHILPIHNYTSYEYVFGSKYIERLVFQRLYNKNTTKLAQLLEVGRRVESRFKFYPAFVWSSF